VPETFANIHPTPELLQRFGSGELHGPEADAIRQHIESCDVCGQKVRPLDQSQPSRDFGDLTTGNYSPDTSPPSAIVPDKLPERVGRYRLEQELARGGMGQVVRVTDEVFQRPLAMKIALGRPRPGSQDRFVREALLTGQLQHPGIPPVQEMGHLEDGRPYFIMKLVKGSDLGKLLRQRSSAAEDLPRLVAIFEQICQTLAYAHSHGLIHRDLKPGNIMVGAFGEVQVMDWGLAKLLTESDGPEMAEEREQAQSTTIFSIATPDALPQETMPGTVMGTSAYMPPEQARGESETLDTRCDVFGLGAILCEVMTGKPPFAEKSSIENHRLSMKGDLSDAIARLDACGADAELVDLARRCLAPDREDRPADAGVVAAAVAHYQAVLQERMKQAEIDKAAALVKMHEERKRRRVNLALAGTIVLVVVGVSISAFWYQGERARQDIKERLQERASSRAHLEEMEALIAQLERRSPEEAASARRNLYQRFADTLIEDLRQPQLDARELTRIDKALKEDLAPRARDLADMVSREMAVIQLAGFKKALDERLPNVELSAAYLDDMDKLIAAVEPLNSGYAREARSELYSRFKKLVQDDLRRDKALTLEDFDRIDAAVALLKTHDPSSWSDLSKRAIERRGLMQTVRVLAPPFDNVLDTISGYEVKIVGAKPAKVEAPPPPAAKTSDDFVLLFNGKDLTGWTAHPKGTGNWRVVDGNLTCSGPASYLFTERNDFKDFHFRIEARVNAKGNSGQYFRCQFGPNMPKGYWAQINNTDPGNQDRTGSLARQPINGRGGALVQIKDVLVADDAWFTQEVIARGNHIRILLNGKITVDFTDKDKMFGQGRLALEHFTPQTRIEFRKVEIKELPSDARVAAPTATGPFLLSPLVGANDLPVVLLNEACRGNVQMEATFAYPSWGAAKRLGLSLNTGADRRRGYAFLIELTTPRAFLDAGDRPIKASGKNQTTLEAARTIPGAISLIIQRNGVTLRQETLKVELPAKALTLRATREGSKLTFEVLRDNSQAPASIRFDDVFATGGAAAGVFALHWPEGVGLETLQLRRQMLPQVPGPLEPADHLLADGQIENALALYHGEASNDNLSAPLRQEARCKEALCLLELRQTDEAAKLLTALVGELSDQGERWPVLAACELWQLYLRQNKRDEADELADNLVARGFKERLASFISEDTRQAILGSANEFSAYSFLLRSSDKRLRNLERLVDLHDSLPDAESGQMGLRYRLCRAYRILGQSAKAQSALENWLRGNVGESQVMFLEELGWTYRERGVPKNGLGPISKFLSDAPPKLAADSNRLRIELARLHVAMGNWEDAERELDKYFAAVKTQRDDYVPFASACLMRGFLLRRRGDEAGAQAAWTMKFAPPGSDDLKSYSLSDPAVVWWSPAVLYAWVLGSLTNQLTDAQAQGFFQERIINTLPQDIRLAANVIGVSLPTTLLREAWRTPRGLEVAQRLAYQDVGLADFLKLPVLVGAYAVVRNTLPAGQKISAEQDELFWRLVEDGWASVRAGNLTKGNLVQLTFAWKGNTSSALGWGALAKALDKQPALRGPLAYVMGHRLLRLGKPREASELFGAALRDAPADSPLRRLAEAELER
jgi:hypothetical protein